jgi:hypothetical protein
LSVKDFGSNLPSTFMEAALNSHGYSRDVAMMLLAAARSGSPHTWHERCVATLLFENQLLKMDAADSAEYGFFFAELGLMGEGGEQPRVLNSVLEEGFSSMELGVFIRELRDRLGLLERVHRRVEMSPETEETRRYLARVANEPTKLTLARWIFSPEEVTTEIVAALSVGRGVETTLARIGTAASVWTGKPVRAPQFEQSILRLLCAGRKTYWVTQACSQELNALVEYPLTSAAIAVKLPGSDLEIEIKRAGSRGVRLVNVVTERNGTTAPLSHRLFGGSIGWLAQRETIAAGLFSTIYRLVHGSESPCSETVQNNALVTLPRAEGETHMLDYLSDGAAFGEGFEAVRDAMRACVEAFPSDTGVRRASYSGPQGETLQFIAQSLPEQAILMGSSSFRLDRLLLYLSDVGDEHYFRDGLRVDYNETEAQWLADTVLEEILGTVMEPVVPFGDYATYMHNNFATPENRKRADMNFLSVMEQIGTCWGTLLAVRGFSDGESFVLRNVGLRSCWRNGAWQVRVIFMDHDDLTVAGSRYALLWPWREASGMSMDSIHILGGKMGDDWIPGDAGALRQIYRVNATTADAGERALRAAARGAYQKTQSALMSDEELRGLFSPPFLNGIRDFDEVVPGLLDAEPDAVESWKTQAATRLRDKGYREQLVSEYVRAIVHFREFFERISFLYDK